MYDYDKLLQIYSLTRDGNNNVILDLNETTGLLSKTGWQGVTGTNTTGFNAYPEGYLNYSSFLRKATQVNANTSAYFLTATNFAYADWSIGNLGVGNVVLALQSSATNSSYGASLLTLPDDQLTLVGAASLRFVKDE